MLLGGLSLTNATPSCFSVSVCACRSSVHGCGSVCVCKERYRLEGGGGMGAISGTGQVRLALGGVRVALCIRCRLSFW